MLETISSFFTAVAVAGTVAFAVFIAGNLVGLAMFVIQRRKGMAREREALDRPLPPEDELPHVVIQIPVYNEGKLVERAIECAAALEWPYSRLHIQVCDNSTDETLEIARAKAQSMASGGIDVTVVHRDGRRDAKAGNLQMGVAAADPSHNYFAVFDVDYIPPRNYLRLCMAPLISDPKLGFVQPRLDYLNRTENALTRGQALFYDSHYATEEAMRCWRGQILLLKGSATLLRRKAIEDAGGWSGETLTEDVDLSCRLWISGWRGLFLISFAVPGELPATRRDWIAQQIRWTTGFGQAGRIRIPALLTRPPVPFWKRLESTMPMVSWWLMPVQAIVLFSVVAAIVLDPALLPTLGAANVLLLVAGEIAGFTQMRMACTFLHGDRIPLSAFALDFLRWRQMGPFMLPGWARAYGTVICGGTGAFERTPKSGVITRPG